MIDALHSSWLTNGLDTIAFDGDGTLWTGDVAETVWNALIERRLVRAEAHAALVRECDQSGLDPSGEAHVLCTRIGRAYAEGRFSEERICEVQAWAFAGWSRQEIAAFVDHTLFDVGHWTDRTIPETRAILDAARAAHAPVYLVSASPKHVVERAAAPLGILPHEVLASTIPFGPDGRALADVERPICYGPGKVAALKRVLEGRPLLAAFGDNVFDLPMLHYARFGVMVRPKARLLATPDAASFQLLPEAS